MDERPDLIARDLANPSANPLEDGADGVDGAAVDSGTTGVAEVDRVLADVADVSSAPVSEHVAVFERAHDQLRRALDAVPEPRPDQQQGA